MIDHKQINSKKWYYYFIVLSYNISGVLPNIMFSRCGKSKRNSITGYIGLLQSNSEHYSMTEMMKISLYMKWKYGT